MKFFFTMIMVFLCLFGLNINNAFGQTDSTTVEKQTVVITMENGEKFKGEIVFEDDEEITLTSENGKIILEVTQIKKIEAVEYDDKFDLVNPNQSRYFYTSSAIPIKEGKAHYHNMLLGFNSASVGITNNISVEGGLELFSAIGGDAMWFFSPKVGFELKENIHLGGGALVMSYDGDVFSLLHTEVTIGDANTNITLGLGTGYADKDFISSPTYNISGIHRFNDHISIMSENYVLSNFNEYLYIGIHGVRWMFKKNALDFGAIICNDFWYYGIPALPFVGYTRSF